MRPSLKVETRSAGKPSSSAARRMPRFGGGEVDGRHGRRQYLKRSITAPNWRDEGVEGLRERVEGLDTREKLKEWLGDAHELGINPL